MSLLQRTVRSSEADSTLVPVKDWLFGTIDILRHHQ